MVFLIRQHNKRRLVSKINQTTQQKLKAKKSFYADNHKFARPLFDKEQHSGKPTFSADEAQHYFLNTYRDKGRTMFTLLLLVLNVSRFLHTIFRYDAQLKMKTNGVSGENEMVLLLFWILFLIPIQEMLCCFKICAETSQMIAYIILLSKSNDLHLVSQFRPMASSSLV